MVPVHFYSFRRGWVMKKCAIVLVAYLCVALFSSAVYGQSGFSIDAFNIYKDGIASLDVNSHISMRKPAISYFPITTLNHANPV